MEEISAAGRNYHRIGISLLLAAVVLALYWPVSGFDFIALDDNLYVVENPHIRLGPTGQGLAWAMTTFHTTNWHPLTWLSLMVDYELFGMKAAGYHITGLLLHLLNTLLLFYTLWRMTGESGKCAVVAALFAVHPLNIESVVWVAERKNLLSTFFCFLTILAYIRYTERREWLRYGVVVICFSLGLMAKPMLVTLPVILLLLDYWPLGRFPSSDAGLGEAVPESGGRQRTVLRLLTEKIPLFFLSVASVLVTYQAAHSGGAVKSLSLFPLAGRIYNAFVSYGMYLVKMIWPSGLVIFYPYSASHTIWQTGAAVGLVAVTSGLVLLKGRHAHYLWVGWLWYLITLLPVIGFIQVGFQSMANRYAYLPLVGIFIVIAWGSAGAAEKSSRQGVPCDLSGSPDPPVGLRHTGATAALEKQRGGLSTCPTGYEEQSRCPVRHGERVAWSGQSGEGATSL